MITDDGRIRASLTTIRELREAGARLVLISHLGRPAGAPDPKYSLRPVAERMAELLENDVVFVAETVGATADAAVASLGDGNVLLLENLRFNPGETSKRRRRTTRLRRTACSLRVMDSFQTDLVSFTASRQAFTILLSFCRAHLVVSSRASLCLAAPH